MIRCFRLVTKMIGGRRVPTNLRLSRILEVFARMMEAIVYVDGSLQGLPEHAAGANPVSLTVQA